MTPTHPGSADALRKARDFIAGQLEDYDDDCGDDRCVDCRSQRAIAKLVAEIDVALSADAALSQQGMVETRATFTAYRNTAGILEPTVCECGWILEAHEGGLCPTRKEGSGGRHWEIFCQAIHGTSARLHIEHPDDINPMLKAAILSAMKTCCEEYMENSKGGTQWSTKPTVTTEPNWARCPSTHCERRQACTSPHECSVRSAAPQAQVTGDWQTHTGDCSGPVHDRIKEAAYNCGWDDFKACSIANEYAALIRRALASHSAGDEEGK